MGLYRNLRVICLSRLTNWLLRKNIKAVFTAAAFTVAVLSFYLHNLLHKLFSIGYLVSLIVFIYGLYLHRKLSRKALLNQFRKQWGNPAKAERNYNKIKDTYYSLNLQNKGCSHLDDQTWSDLLMNDIYSEIDRTQTSCGQALLYNILRNPIVEPSKWEQRKKAIHAFHKDTEFREKLQMILHKLGKQNKEQVEKLLTDDLPLVPKFWMLLEIVPYISLASIIAAFLLFSQHRPEIFLAPFSLIFIISITNGIIRHKLKRGIMAYSASIGYLSRIIYAARSIKQLSATGLEIQLKKLSSAYETCKVINNKAYALNLERVDPFGLYSYVNILFLIDVRMFFRVIGDICKFKNDLITLYSAIGELDALCSIASFQDGYADITEPVFINKSLILEADNIVHPLIDNAVANSIWLNEKGALITGSNMSGKSTFLRTIGVNVVLAQSICTAFASRYKSAFFQVSTSISQSDNLLGGKSYFLAEAETLLRMLNRIRPDLPSICIIDEIFRGTNSIERIAAASQLLKHMSGLNALTIVATHDIELTDMVKGEYDVYYFDEDVGTEGLIFDYHLRKGIAPTRNAVKILDYLGYPKEIVENSKAIMNRRNTPHKAT
jgi:hypothetical protein